MTQEATPAPNETPAPAEGAPPPEAAQEAAAAEAAPEETSDPYFDALLGVATEVSKTDGEKPAEATSAEAEPVAEPADGDADEQPAPEQEAKPDDAAETKDGDEGKPKDKAAKPKRPKVVDAPPNWRKKMFERKAKQADKAKAEEEKTASIVAAALQPHLEKQEQTIAELRAQITQQQPTAPEKPKTPPNPDLSLSTADPFELMQRVAAERGITPDQVFQHISAKVLGQEAPPLPPPRPKVAESPEVRALREQVAALQAEQKKLAETALTPQKLYQQQADQQIRHSIGQIASVQANPRLAEQFPYLNAMHPDRLAVEARDAVHAAIKHERFDLLTPEGLPEMMKLLDEGMKEEHLFMQSRIKVPSQDKPSASTASSQAQGKPPTGKPGQPKATSNKAAASVSGASAGDASDAAYDALLGLIGT